ncbi:MAG: MogA/MoaB family molybdenum cofactor biosynthesis protein [Candidatus Binatia bacterium]
MVAKEHLEKSKDMVMCLVVTVSDTRDENTDQSGQLIKSLLKTGGHQVVDYRIVKDNPTEIGGLLRQALKQDGLEVILLTGGTGISPRDGTYEVIDHLLEKRLDGFGEIFHLLSYQDIGPSAIMSRALAGMAAGKIIISLPGSRAAVDLGMRQLVLPVLGHMVSQVQGK